MIIPLLTFQHLLITKFHTTFVLALIVAIPIDVCTMYSWRKHLMGTMIQNLLLFMTVHMYTPVKDLQSVAKLTKYTDSLCIALFTLLDLVVFALLEKVMKEFWVIRETTEKSFRMFHSMIDENNKEIFIIDEGMNLIYMNQHFESTVKRLIKDEFPTQLKDFIHENSYDSFRDQLLESIKDRKEWASTVYLLKKKESIKESTGNKDANATLLSSGTAILIANTPH